MNRSRWFAALLAVATATAIGSVPSAVAAIDPYEIYAILPQTGQMAFVGRGEAQAIQLVENLENKAGGINGRPVKFVILDDESDARVGVQLLNGIMTKQIPVVLGSTLQAICGAMAPLVKDGPVIMCLSNGIHPVAGSFVFAMGPDPQDMAMVVLRYLRMRGLTKIALMTSTDATGRDGDVLFDNAFHAAENAGALTLATQEHFGTNDLSVAAQMSHIRASGAQVIIAWTSGTPFGTLLRGVSEAGLDLPVLTPYSNSTYAQMEAYKAILPREALFIGVPSLAPEGLQDGPVRRAVLEYDSTFKSIGVRPDVGTNNGWDPPRLVISALRHYGTSMTAEQFRGYLSSLRNWVGVSGEYNFLANPNRGIGPNGTLIQRWDPARGTWVAVSKLGGEPYKVR